MKFPDRLGGATGALVRANQFDQSPTAPFSKTRQGDQTIHKRNGDLWIERDARPATNPPYLYSHWPDGGFDFNNPLADKPVTRRFGLDGEDREDTTVSSPAMQSHPVKSVGGRHYLGDGLWMQLSNNAQGLLELMLVPVDDPGNPTGTGIFFENLHPQATYGVSFAPMGFKDAQHRYTAAVFTVAALGDVGWQYVAYLVSSGTRSVYRTVALPELPDSPYESSPTSGDYRVQWWHNQLGTSGFWQDKGFAKMYGVGRGRLLTVLVGQERIQTDDEGAWGIVPPYLPEGSAPYLLRSDDFGETWRMDKADFLAECMPVVEGIEGMPKVQTFAMYSQTFACPLGDGRIALAAAGLSLAPPLGTENPTNSAPHYNAQTLRLFVSDTNGRNFALRPWPLDAARNEWPFTTGPSEPGRASIARPLFGTGMGYTYPMTTGIGTLGPGTLYAITVGETCTNPGYQWGSYPQDYPVVAHITRNGGLSWEAERIPAAALPLAASLQQTKFAWLAADPINTGNGRPASDAWPLLWLDFCVLDPCNALGQGGRVALVSPEFTGPMALAMTDGPRTFADMARGENLEPEGYVYGSHPSRAAGLPHVEYVGDANNDEFPELVYLGFPEFEART